jgi:hypothetical protein
MLTVPRVPMPPNTGMNPPALRGALVATLLGIAEVRSSQYNTPQLLSELVEVRQPFLRRSLSLEEARFAELALVNDAVENVVAPPGRLDVALTIAIKGEEIAGYELNADPTVFSS